MIYDDDDDDYYYYYYFNTEILQKEKKPKIQSTHHKPSNQIRASLHERKRVSI